MDELFKNPQYLLDLTNNDGKVVGTIISLYNKAIRLTGKDMPEQKYFAVVFLVDSIETEIAQRFGPSDIRSKKLSQATVPVQEDIRESFEIHNLAKGRYVIIPAFGSFTGVKGQFLLRVFTDGNSTLKELK